MTFANKQLSKAFSNRQHYMACPFEPVLVTLLQFALLLAYCRWSEQILSSVIITAAELPR